MPWWARVSLSDTSWVYRPRGRPLCVWSQSCSLLEAIARHSFDKRSGAMWISLTLISRMIVLHCFLFVLGKWISWLKLPLLSLQLDSITIYRSRQKEKENYYTKIKAYSLISKWYWAWASSAIWAHKERGVKFDQSLFNWSNFCCILFCI